MNAPLPCCRAVAASSPPNTNPLRAPRPNAAACAAALWLALLALPGCSSKGGATADGAAGQTDAAKPPGPGDGSTASLRDRSARPPSCDAKSTEVCDGLDNDCDGVVDNGFALLCQPCGAAAGSGCIEAQLGGGAWWTGIARNLLVGNDRGIALPPLPRPNDYIYIANSGEDTVSKVRVADGVEVARILVGDNPSRTAVDGNGDAWVAMRGSLGDTTPTSGELDNVVKIDGNCTPRVKPPTPTRECILLDIQKVGNLLRGVAIDARNDVWIGSWATREVVQLDGKTGAIKQRIALQPPSNPYGVAIDPDGMLWVAAREGEGAVFRVDPILKKVDLALRPQDLGNLSPYGLAPDGEGGIWFGSFGKQVFRVDTASGAFGPTYSVGVATRGVAVDDAGYLWAADSNLNQALRIDRQTGALLASVPVGQAPVGIGIDHQGNVWAANQSSDDATKISPEGKVLIQSVPVGKSPYTYSDMTGSAFRLFKKLRGTFTGSFGVGITGARWRSVRWKGNVPSPAKLTLRVRAADDDPASAAWQDVVLKDGRGTLSARGATLQVEIVLYTDDRSVLPNVEQLIFELGR